MFLISSIVPLHMPMMQMLSFCGIGFLVVMIVLTSLFIFTSIIGRFFAAIDKK